MGLNCPSTCALPRSIRGFVAGQKSKAWLAGAKPVNHAERLNTVRDPP
jgi:hypothetical protein